MMNVFFAVTTFAVIIVAALFAVGLWYVVRILRHLEYLARQAAEESDEVRRDLLQLHAQIRTEGFRLKRLVDFFRRYPRRKRVTSRQ